MRNYTDLIRLKTFEERIKYLRLDGTPSEETFGPNRYLNQNFYSSADWKAARNSAIVRDAGFDLGILDRPILGSIYVHHMNPINEHVLIHNVDLALDVDGLICVSFNTHQYIHYGRKTMPEVEMVVRKPNDTTLWEKINGTNNSTASKKQFRGI